MANTQKTPTSTPTARGDKSFFYLMLGGFISMIGDQFTLIGLPWLTLKVTGDPVALGLVLAIIGIPRAVFILLGGAIVDRYSPKSVLLVSKYINTLLLGGLAACVYTGTLSEAILYGFAATIGLSSAFAIPAGSSMLPFVVPRDKLAQANGLMMGVRQVTFFLGPLIAGLVIAGFGSGQVGIPTQDGPGVEDTPGLALVFALDALSFFLSALALYLIKMRTPSRPDADESTQASVWRLLVDGLRRSVADVEMRSIFLYMALIQMFVVGPLQVGLPMLSETRLDGGAASFGTIMAANGVGVLIGLVLSGAGLSLGFRTLGWMLLCVDCAIGAAVAGFGFVSTTLMGGAIMLGVGVLGGMVQVKAFAWLQARTPEDQMGRVMSLFMFIVMGVAPVAASAGGWVLRHTDITSFFIGCGVAMALVALTAMMIPTMRAVGRFSPEKAAQST